MCGKCFGYSVYERLVTDLRVFMKTVSSKVGAFKEEKKEVQEEFGSCFNCKADTEIARLHSACNICFCKVHFSELGKKIHKNHSIF